MNRLIKIIDIAELNRETFKKNEFPEFIKYLDTGNLTKNKIDEFQYLKTKEDKVPSRAQRKIKNHTILYSTVRPNQEHYGIFEKEINDLVVSTGFTTIDIVDKNINPKYIFYLLTQSNITEYLHTIGMNAVSSYPSISPNDIGNLKFHVPDLPTQKSIAKVLSDLDAKIALNNRINKELEAMAKTLYDYWFVQFDFPFDFASTSSATAQGKPCPEAFKEPCPEALEGQNNKADKSFTLSGVEGSEVKGYKSSGGKMVYNKELKREIPEGWEVKELGELGEFKNGVNYDPSNPGLIPCPIINVRNISSSSIFIRCNDLDIVYLNQVDVEKYSIKDDDIIIARSGIPGATRLMSEHKPNTLYCGFTIRYQLKKKEFKNAVFFFLKMIEKSISSGSGGTIMKNVNQETLKGLKIAIQVELLPYFNNQIEPIFKKTNQIIQENQQLTTLRDWLLPMLMNGQVASTNSATLAKEK